MFGKKKKLPGCIAFVDFEHWYISLERQYGVKPDIRGWKAELEKSFEVEEIAVFGDFSNSGLRAELDKIRDVTPMVFDTKNPSEHYKKDFTVIWEISSPCNCRTDLQCSEILLRRLCIFCCAIGNVEYRTLNRDCHFTGIWNCCT